MKFETFFPLRTKQVGRARKVRKILSSLSDGADAEGLSFREDDVGRPQTSPGMAAIMSGVGGTSVSPHSVASHHSEDFRFSNRFGGGRVRTAAGRDAKTLDFPAERPRGMTTGHSQRVSRLPFRDAASLRLPLLFLPQEICK